MNGKNQQGGQENPLEKLICGEHQQTERMNPIEKLIWKLENEAITDFKEKEIFHPDGCASKVMEYINNSNSKERRVKITSVQLRRIFHEFKAIVDRLKKESDSRLNEAIERAMGRLYRLYAILEYQTRREVLDKGFKEIMFKLFNNIEREVEKVKKEIEGAKNEEKEEGEKDKEIRDKVIKIFEKAHDLLMAMVAYSKRS
jgi:CRISPR/Cas system CSM-associated protein Csm2 small subunit